MESGRGARAVEPQAQAQPRGERGGSAPRKIVPRWRAPGKPFLHVCVAFGAARGNGGGWIGASPTSLGPSGAACAAQPKKPRRCWRCPLCHILPLPCRGGAPLRSLPAAPAYAPLAGAGEGLWASGGSSCRFPGGFGGGRASLARFPGELGVYGFPAAPCPSYRAGPIDPFDRHRWGAQPRGIRNLPGGQWEEGARTPRSQPGQRPPRGSRCCRGAVPGMPAGRAGVSVTQLTC